MTPGRGFLWTGFVVDSPVRRLMELWGPGGGLGVVALGAGGGGEGLGFCIGCSLDPLALVSPPPLVPLIGPLIGGPQCRLSILRVDNVPCRYF